MYSNNIEQICGLCVHSKSITGIKTHMQCDKYGAVPVKHTCKRFKYDIFKKPIHKKKQVSGNYSPDDFSIDD